MPTFDISRVAFNPAKHYSSVRMQQGRVLTDDDWNENERIENEDRRRSRIDIIGPYGSPDDGFKISKIALKGDGTFDFNISKGTIYLGGLRMDLEHDQTYKLQTDWLEMPATDYTLPDAATISNVRYDAVYLEAWQQPVSAVEDSELFEKALGGPDTTTRVRNMARVNVQTDIGADNCADAWSNLKTQWAGQGLGTINAQMQLKPKTKLKVSFTSTGKTDDLCSPQVAGEYLGAENQAIRVQLTDTGKFTWGFDNASPYYRVQVAADGLTVTMLTLPKDQYHWPLSGQIVEILPWSAILPNGEKIAARAGHLSKVDTSFNPDAATLTLLTKLPDPSFGNNWLNRSDNGTILKPDDGPMPFDAETAQYFYMRAWNRGTDLTSDVQLTYTGTPVTLGNTGLVIEITGPDHVPGDHWVIAARPDDPAEVVPWRLMYKNGIFPMAFHRFFAPIGIIQWTNAGGTLDYSVIHDCRKTFNPLTDQECCCTCTVGDGVTTHGDFSTIEDAISSLPADGGEICVLAGIHYTNAVISGLSQITISGCGDQTIVLPRKDSKPGDPIFLVTSSEKIRLEKLTLFSVQGIAIQVGNQYDATSGCNEIYVVHNRIIALLCGVYISPLDQITNSTNIYVGYNKIGVIDKTGGGPGIFCFADDALIERNVIKVIPDTTRTGGGSQGGGPGGGVFDPCFSRNNLYKDRTYLLTNLKGLLSFVNGAYFKTKAAFTAKGGIIIGSGSERTGILQNKVTGGSWNGITIGSLPPAQLSTAFYTNDQAFIYGTSDQVHGLNENFISSVYDIVIEENIISQMGLSGIGVDAFISTKDVGLMFRVENIDVFRNVITNCARQVPEKIVATMINEVGFGGICFASSENAVIKENIIENNGINYLDPICGIFILYGAKTKITDNRIVNNGIRISDQTNNSVKQGERGGIVIKMALQLKDSVNFVDAAAPASDAVPAAKIQGNIVDHPYGHALFLVAFGQVAVVNNQLTSKGNAQNVYSLLAGAVLILDLGVSKDLLLILLALRGSASLGVSSEYGTSSNAANDKIIQAYDFLPSGKVLFSDNQVCMDMRNHASTFGLSAQFIFSLDDIGFNNNQSECTGFISIEQKTLDIVFADSILLGITIRSNNNRFTEGITLTLYSLLSFGIMNTAIGNQATHCLHVLGAMPPIERENMVLISAKCKNDTERIKHYVALHK